jgi:prepilin-type N-terminal cleavage/methylation domain
MTKRGDATQHTHTHTPATDARSLNFKRRAFTLVELLVVISIIGLLSTIAVTSLSSTRRQARNAKRIADAKQLVTAFNLGLDANGAYPSTGGDIWKCISSACTGTWSGYPSSGTVDTFFQPFMTTKPTDPSDSTRTGTGYFYDGAWAGGSGLPAGSYVNYLLEPPASCNIGTVINTTVNYVSCVVKLE